MRSRIIWMVVGALAVSTAAVALEFREEPYRVGIIDVGEPILLEYPELTNEMRYNNELRDWIDAFGRPEYAEYQKVALSPPFLPYEIRLYYIEGRKYVAFGRVHVAAAGERNFGVRKFVGKLDSSMLQRLLTARPLSQATAMVAPAQPQYAAPAYRAEAAVAEPAAPMVEEVAVEEVVEIVSPEEAVVGDVVAVEEITGISENVEGEVAEIVIEEDIVIEPADPGMDN